MIATKLDKMFECPICNGSGDDPISPSADCRRCEGTSEINRYGPGDSSKYGGNVVILTERISDHTDVLHIQRMPISDKKTGGFNERYGDAVVSDVSNEPIASYQQDMKDRLQNQLGKNTDSMGSYQMPNTPPYDGISYSKNDMPKQTWPTDPDLTMDQIITWLSIRGDDYTANIFSKIRSELNL